MTDNKLNYACRAYSNDYDIDDSEGGLAFIILQGYSIQARDSGKAINTEKSPFRRVSW
jgi:hypothetical protein